MSLIQTLANKVNPSSNVMPIYQEWPPEEHTARIKWYKTCQMIFDGDHLNAFEDSDDMDRFGRYIVCNVGALIVKALNDLLFGEELTLEMPKGTSDKDAQRVTDIWERNQGQTLYFESGLETMNSGDGITTLRAEDGKAYIEPANVISWVPEIDPDNVRHVLSHTLAWEREVKTGREIKKYLRMVVHEKGKIINKLFEMQGGRIKAEVNLSVLYDDPPEEEQDTGVDDFLLVHTPNFRISREYFGRSEYLGLESLFSALNARLTQSDFVFEKHSDPILGIPADTFSVLLKEGGGEIDKKELQTIRMGENGEKPEYTTWDSKMDSAAAFIDGLLDKILLISETARQLIGDEKGGVAESGRALKYRLMRTLAKVNRKRNYYSHTIPATLSLAQQLEGAKDPVKVNIKWPDGLPQDVIETIEAEERKLAAGLTSRKRSIMVVDNLNEKEADERAQEIEAEEEKMDAQVAARVAPGQRVPPQIKVDVGGLEEA